MLEKLRLLSATLGLLAVASFPAESADDIKPPSGYRHWFHVNTMVVDKASPLFEGLGGMHNVYINTTGEAALKKGGTYPNKSMFVRLLRGRRPQGNRRHGQGRQEIRIHRRLGLSVLRRRRRQEAGSD